MDKRAPQTRKASISNATPEMDSDTGRIPNEGNHAGRLPATRSGSRNLGPSRQRPDYPQGPDGGLNRGGDVDGMARGAPSVPRSRKASGGNAIAGLAAGTVDIAGPAYDDVGSTPLGMPQRRQIRPRASRTAQAPIQGSEEPAALEEKDYAPRGHGKASATPTASAPSSAKTTRPRARAATRSARAEAMRGDHPGYARVGDGGYAGRYTRGRVGGSGASGVHSGEGGGGDGGEGEGEGEGRYVAGGWADHHENEVQPVGFAGARGNVTPTKASAPRGKRSGNGGASAMAPSPAPASYPEPPPQQRGRAARSGTVPTVKPPARSYSGGVGLRSGPEGVGYGSEEEWAEDEEERHDEHGDHGGEDEGWPPMAEVYGEVGPMRYYGEDVGGSATAPGGYGSDEDTDEGADGGHPGWRPASGPAEAVVGGRLRASDRSATPGSERFVPGTIDPTEGWHGESGDDRTWADGPGIWDGSPGDRRQSSRAPTHPASTYPAPRRDTGGGSLGPGATPQRQTFAGRVGAGGLGNGGNVPSDGGNVGEESRGRSYRGGGVGATRGNAMHRHERGDGYDGDRHLDLRKKAVDTRDELEQRKRELERMKADAVARIEVEHGADIDRLKAELDEAEGMIRIEAKKAERELRRRSKALFADPTLSEREKMGRLQELRAEYESVYHPDDEYERRRSARGVEEIFSRLLGGFSAVALTGMMPGRAVYPAGGATAFVARAGRPGPAVGGWATVGGWPGGGTGSRVEDGGPRIVELPSEGMGDDGAGPLGGGGGGGPMAGDGSGGGGFNARSPGEAFCGGADGMGSCPGNGRPPIVQEVD